MTSIIHVHVPFVSDLLPLVIFVGYIIRCFHWQHYTPFCHMIQRVTCIWNYINHLPFLLTFVTSKGLCLV